LLPSSQPPLADTPNASWHTCETDAFPRDCISTWISRPRNTGCPQCKTPLSRRQIQSVIFPLWFLSVAASACTQCCRALSTPVLSYLLHRWLPRPLPHMLLVVVLACHSAATWSRTCLLVEFYFCECRWREYSPLTLVRSIFGFTCPVFRPNARLKAIVDGTLALASSVSDKLGMVCGVSCACHYFAPSRFFMWRDRLERHAADDMGVSRSAWCGCNVGFLFDLLLAL
jgi:hypothetical protein